MLGTLIQKELKAMTLSPKFIATFSVCSFLLIMSVLIGINEYKQAVAQYETVNELANERLNQVSTWHAVTYREHRKPSPLQIFTSGLSYDIGRWSDIEAESTIKMKNSIYSDDPIFAVFRILDFTFIVQIVFSLLAILFTFDAINGEKESGTLRLVFSNAVSRTKYILAKCIGSWLGLMIPIVIPILISVLLVVLLGIPFTATEWVRLILIIGTSLLYLTFFVVFGVFISTLSKRSSVSFLFSLVLWIAFVLIIPRGGVVAAGHIISVPRLGEIEGQRDAYSKSKWEEFYRENEERWRRVSKEDTDPNSTGDEEGGVDEGEVWAQMKEEQEQRKQVTIDIENYEAMLLDDLKNKQKVQQNLGFILSRFSPAATYQLAVMTLSSTDLNMKATYEEALNDYRTRFNDYVEEKSANAGPGAGSIMITVDSEKGFDMQMGRQDAIDVSDRPVFTHPIISLAEIMPGVMINIAILLLMTLAVLIGAYYSFIRYDLR